MHSQRAHYSAVLNEVFLAVVIAAIVVVFVLLAALVVPTSRSPSISIELKLGDDNAGQEPRKTGESKMIEGGTRKRRYQDSEMRTRIERQGECHIQFIRTNLARHLGCTSGCQDGRPSTSGPAGS